MGRNPTGSNLNLDTIQKEVQAAGVRMEGYTKGQRGALADNARKAMNSGNKINLLRDTRCYLIGHMQYSDGRGWRDTVKQELGGSGIKFYDPYHKPFVHDIPEDENSRAEMLHWMETGQFDLVAQRMKEVRGYDLRLCDICDWFIAVIKPTIASWGSAEEITTIIREKKPLFLVIDDPKGKKACPLWLLGVLPHKYVYDTLDEAVRTIKGIDEGIVRTNSDRWKLLLPELR